MIAEAGDDLSTISLPEEDSPSPTSSQEALSSRDSSSQSSESPAEAPSNAESSSLPAHKPKAEDEQQKGSAQRQRHRLYPSVQHIVREKALSDAEVDKIPTSGPNGRLLKGDVLAYLGLIHSSYPSELSERVSKLGHLDLSNIKPSTPKQVVDPTTRSESSVVTPSRSLSSPSSSPEAEKPTTLTLPISLDAVLQVQRRIRRVLGIELPLSTFISRATEIANQDSQPASSPKETTTVSADRLFNEILGLDKILSSSSSVSARTATRLSKAGFTPQITATVEVKSTSSITDTQSRGRHSTIDDIYDLLTTPTVTTSLGSGTTKPKPQPLASSASSSSSSFSSSPITRDVISVNIPNPSSDEERRARTFLGRVKTILELQPGRLIL